MSALSRQAFAPYLLTDRSEFTQIRPMFNGYNTNPDNSDKILYLSGFTNGAAISGGSVANSLSQPVLARKYENNGSIYRLDSVERPASYADTLGKTVTSTGVGSGFSFTGVTFSVDEAGFIMFTAKETTGNPTFTLRTSLGNARTFAFTGASFVAVSNGYKRFIAPIAVGTYAGVTVANVGTFVPGNVTSVEAISSIAAVIDWDSIHLANNVESFIGSHQSLLFSCVDELTWNRTLDTADQKCSNYTTGVTVTNKTLEIDLKYNDLNFGIEAAAIGQSVKRGTVSRPVIINAVSGGNNALAVTAGVITIAGLVASRIASVTMNNIPLTRVESIALVNETTYSYVGGNFNFSTLYNTVVPTIVYLEVSTGNFFDDLNLQTGYTGNLFVTRTSSVGTTLTWELPLVEIVSVTPEQGDAQVTHNVKIKAYPFKEGNNYRFYRQTKF